MIAYFSHTDLSDISCTSHGGAFAVQSIEQAYAFCEKIARSHYENFPVASYLLPARIRSHVLVIYTFSRIADDIADEYSIIHGADKADQVLTIMHHFCKKAHDGEFVGTNPLWLAMQEMFTKTALPITPFERLLQAFTLDIHFEPPRTFEDILEYCDYSANPIGELLLRLYGLWNVEIKQQSDALCTALQITNFLQDISVDRTKQRVYIPMNMFLTSELVENYLAKGEITPNFSEAIANIVMKTEALFEQSKSLPWLISNTSLRMELLLILFSGQKIFRKCIQEHDSLPFHRPRLEILDYTSIFLRFLVHMPMILLRR